MKYLKLLCITLILAAVMPHGISVSKAEEGGEESEEAQAAKRAKPKYVTLEPAFVTNFMDERIRYFRTDITIKANNGDTEESIRKHVYAVRHALVMLFSRQTEQTLMSVEGREQLQKDATSEVINILADENSPSDIQNVLFTTFVVE